MTTYIRGTSAELAALFFSAPSSPVDVGNLSLSVVSQVDGSVLLGPVTTGFTHPSTGAYLYTWSVPFGAPIGGALVLWTGNVATTGAPIAANEEITIAAEASAGVTGPCDTWPVRWTCPLTGVSPEITGMALEAASEILYQLTGQRFSECTVALRPCREECYGTGYGWSWRGSGWWGDYGYPTPVNIGGQWFNLGCGQCGTNCSCSPVSETYLPGPVVSITQVLVDGVELVNGVDYRVDDYRKLVRLGDQWPFCNDLNKASTEVGTWEVTAVYGEPVPVLGQMAVGELACEFIKLFTGQECSLPNGITELTRQGVSMSFANASNDLLQLFARYPLSYLFIQTYNPYNLRARARAYDLDGPEFRAVGTA